MHIYKSPSLKTKSIALQPEEASAARGVGVGGSGKLWGARGSEGPGGADPPGGVACPSPRARPHCGPGLGSDVTLGGSPGAGLVSYAPRGLGRACLLLARRLVGSQGHPLLRSRGHPAGRPSGVSVLPAAEEDGGAGSGTAVSSLRDRETEAREGGRPTQPPRAEGRKQGLSGGRRARAEGHGCRTLGAVLPPQKSPRGRGPRKAPPVPVPGDHGSGEHGVEPLRFRSSPVTEARSEAGTWCSGAEAPSRHRQGVHGPPPPRGLPGPGNDL